VSERGTLVVCDAGDAFKILSTAALGGGEPSRSSVAVSGSQLFVRTAENLICLGK
jgi:hypothetical protein